MRDADIEQQNLVYVSSILPPRCEVVAREAGVELLRPGDITFCVLARSETNEFGRHLYASLGLARPADPDMYGYISELHGYGMTAEASGEEAEDLAASIRMIRRRARRPRIREQPETGRAQQHLGKPQCDAATGPQGLRCANP